MISETYQGFPLSFKGVLEDSRVVIVDFSGVPKEISRTFKGFSRSLKGIPGCFMVFQSRFRAFQGISPVLNGLQEYSWKF